MDEAVAHVAFLSLVAELQTDQLARIRSFTCASMLPSTAVSVSSSARPDYGCVINRWSKHIEWYKRYNDLLLYGLVALVSETTRQNVALHSFRLFEDARAPFFDDTEARVQDPGCLFLPHPLPQHGFRVLSYVKHMMAYVAARRPQLQAELDRLHAVDPKLLPSINNIEGRAVVGMTSAEWSEFRDAQLCNHTIAPDMGAFAYRFTVVKSSSP
jgi:hypothetical protein